MAPTVLNVTVIEVKYWLFKSLDSVIASAASQPTMILLLPETLSGMVTVTLYDLDAPAAREVLVWSSSHVSVGEPSKTPLLLLSNHMAEVLEPVSYTHLRAHETKANLVCRLLL